MFKTYHSTIQMLLHSHCSSLLCRFTVLPGGSSFWRWLQGPADVEAVPPHVLLGADVVLHLQACVEDGVLLCRPAEPGESLVKGVQLCTRGVYPLRFCLTCSEIDFFLFYVSFRPCMCTWKLLTSACCQRKRPGLLERMRWSSLGKWAFYGKRPTGHV